MTSSRSKGGASAAPKRTTQVNTKPPPEKLSKMVAELLRLKQENRQLRRELDDANYRIRALEKERALALHCTLDGPDDCSVEIHSAPSVTSSITTIPTGSYPANQSRLRQKQRELVSGLRQEPPDIDDDDSSVESSRENTPLLNFRSNLFYQISQSRMKGLLQPFEGDLPIASQRYF